MAKRRRTSSEDIFTEFHANKPLLLELKTAVYDIREGKDELGFCILKLMDANARSSTSFTNAHCTTQPYVRINTFNRSQRQTFSLGHVFAHGVEVIEEYIDDPKNIPLNEGARTALCKLLAYWSIPLNQMALAEDKDYGTDCDLALTLAQHLLSRLAVKKEYKIDNGYTGKRDRCPCQTKDTLNGVFTDTSIGLKTGWHGSYDLLLNDDVPVAIQDNTHVVDSTSESDSDAEEAKDRNNFSSGQLISQCIISSFMQRKNNQDLNRFLSPLIGMSTNIFILYFYDCENDILIQTPEIQYLFSGIIKKSALLVIWMAVNYKYFCSGLTPSILDRNFKADFFRRVDERLQNYKVDVESPCHVATVEIDKYWGKQPHEPYRNFGEFENNYNLTV